ncbi:unnamed protein product [Cercospora beticola]|nr:unnamed protein product [Cercospora beticola]
MNIDGGFRPDFAPAWMWLMCFLVGRAIDKYCRSVLTVGFGHLLLCRIHPSSSTIFSYAKMTSTAQRAFNQLSLTRLPCSSPLRLGKSVAQTRTRPDAGERRQTEPVRSDVVGAKNGESRDTSRDDHDLGKHKQSSEELVWWKATSLESPGLVESFRKEDIHQNRSMDRR